MNAPTPALPQFLLDHLAEWEISAEPAPHNELASVRAWLQTFGRLGPEQALQAMRRRALLLMAAEEAFGARVPRMQWVPVENGPPPVGIMVALRVPEWGKEFPITGWYDGARGYFDYDSAPITAPVTHWLVLPPMPASEPSGT